MVLVSPEKADQKRPRGTEGRVGGASRAPAQRWSTNATAIAPSISRIHASSK